jgi:hypothetical protein
VSSLDAFALRLKAFISPTYFSLPNNFKYEYSIKTEGIINVKTYALGSI